MSKKIVRETKRWLDSIKDIPIFQPTITSYSQFTRQMFEDVQKRIEDSYRNRPFSSVVIDSLSGNIVMNGGSGVLNPDSPCNRCNEGILKLEFVKDSKDNYCLCPAGTLARTIHEEVVNGVG